MGCQVKSQKSKVKSQSQPTFAFLIFTCTVQLLSLYFSRSFNFVRRSRKSSALMPRRCANSSSELSSLPCFRRRKISRSAGSRSSSSCMIPGRLWGKFNRFIIRAFLRFPGSLPWKFEGHFRPAFRPAVICSCFNLVRGHTGEIRGNYGGNGLTLLPGINAKNAAVPGA